MRLVLSPARDALAEYLRTLALTQSLVAEAAPDIDANGLAPIWLRICREAGERLPRHYLSIGLLGLRRLPKVDQALQLPWVSGLAQWALARHPSDSEFKAEWLALKPLYPRAPQSWRRLVANLLSATTFKEEDIEAPAWWHVDRDFAPMVRGTFQSSDAPLRSPMPRDCERVIEKLNEPFDYVEPMIDDLFYGHRLYLHATGDAQYFVRAIHALGRELIDRGGDKPHARAKKAQSIAREGLKWQPYDRHLWALWRDSYVADNAAEAAELIGWEFIRRDPTDVNARTQLATILVNFLGKRDEAEILLKETIERFPDNAVARSELAELLIFEDRIAEAARVVNAAFSVGATDKATYALRARLYSNESRPDDARKAIKEGLELDPNERVLKEYDQRLSRGENLPLKSRAFSSADRSGQFGARPQLISDPALAEVIRFGTMRQLRFQLEFGSENDRESALQELRKALRDDPTFSYAELLAARHRIWEADVDVLPSFAAAFENALATEDREKLERLAIRQPRLEMLILMARAVLGDAEAARKIERWLREPEVTDGEQAIAGLHSALRPLLRVVEGGRSIKDALSEVRETVIGALHDANEAALGEALLAA